MSNLDRGGKGPMRSLCTGCFRWRLAPVGKLCEECVGQLKPMEPMDPLIALYAYEGLLKDLIWRAKISGDLAALRVLIELAVSNPKVKESAAWSDHILAAPSSLWGRIRGRYDIAAAVAGRLVKEFCKGEAIAPRHLFWSFQKRARLRHRGSVRNQLRDRCISQTEGKRLLVIDDLLTSGQTVLTLVTNLPNYQVKLVTLAGA